MVRKKAPMQVDEEFRKKILELQGKLLSEKLLKISSAELTKKIVNSNDFRNIENSILGNMDNFDIRIKFDRRKG